MRSLPPDKHIPATAALLEEQSSVFLDHALAGTGLKRIAS
jgi:hypothetical protein